MKKIITPLFAALSIHFAAPAQVIFSENFESTAGTALPTGWTKVCTGPTEWESGTNTYFTGGAWIINPHTRFVGLNDNAAGAGANNMTQRLITPAINFTNATGPALKFQAAYIQSTQWWGEELMIRYSVNNGPWLFLEEITGNTVANWETKLVDLNALTGLANVRLAFEYSDNGAWEFGAMIDDVEVFQNAANNVRVLSVNIPEMAVPNTVAKCFVRNMGSNAITSLSMNYIIDGGIPVTQTFTGLSIAPFDTHELAFSTAIPALTLGLNHTITINAVQVNNTADPDVNDNTASETFMSATQSVVRAGLIEDFGSSSCIPCSHSAEDFDPVLLLNNANSPGANLNVIKYQMDFPGIGDRNYNIHAGSRQYYYGINGIPSLWINGTYSYQDNQQGIDESKTPPAYATVSGSYTIDGDSLRVTANMIPYFTSSDSFHLKLALVQRHFSLDTTDPHQLTDQTEFYHVMRRMIPNSVGFPLYTGIAANQNYSYNYAVDFAIGNVQQDDYNFNFWSDPVNTDLVIFLQGWPSRKVYQSVVVPAALPAGVKQIENELKVLVYPNPAKDRAVVTLDIVKETSVQIHIFDALGKLVYRKDVKATQGRNNVVLNTEEFMPGIYSVNIQAANGCITEKLSVYK